MLAHLNISNLVIMYASLNPSYDTPMKNTTLICYVVNVCPPEKFTVNHSQHQKSRPGNYRACNPPYKRKSTKTKNDS